MKRIALFGTSADPPTAGHETILRWLSQHYDLVAVWASDNPFKQHKTTLAHRTEMLKLMIADVQKQQNNIYFYKELSHLRSLITLRKAQKIWGDSVEFTLVIGADLVQQIFSWYQIEKLLQEVKLLIIPRPGYAWQQQDLEKISKLGGKYAIANITPPAVSSTSYRQKGNEQAITSSVQAYINQQQLYS